MPNKTKMLVLTGVILLLLAAVNLPVLTYIQADSSGQEALTHIFGMINLLPAGLILLALLLKWKWRGVLWILISLAGALLTPFYASGLYYKAMTAGGSSQVSMSDPTAGIGMLAIFICYLIILAGSIWDLRVQRKESANPREFSRRVKR